MSEYLGVINKKFKQSMIMMVISFALGFLFMEILFRFYIFGFDSLSIRKINSTNGLGVSGLITASDTPDQIYELKTNLRTTFKMVPFETNSKGLRDKEYSFEAPVNSFRGVIIGDSLTMGSGVEIEKTYHSLLEEKFNKDKSGMNFEFINFGVGGYSLRQYLAVLNSKAILYNPDFVIVGFYPGNDHRILAENRYEEQYIPKEKAYSFLSSFVLKEISQLKVKIFNYLDPASLYPTTEEIDYMSTIFSEFREYSEYHKTPIIIVYLTTKTTHAVSSDLIKNIAQDNNLYFVDVSKSFDQNHLKDYAIYRTDFHPNAQANSVFAKEIYEFMIKIFPEITDN